MTKPRLFIGSSVESLSVAYAVQENLAFVAETTVWDQDVFSLSESSLESLITALDMADFGIFIFCPDDSSKLKGKMALTVRDNVIFELGLFIGKLTRRRSFIVMPDTPEFHLPTDLIGFNPAKYEADRSDGNMKAATGAACNKIREIIKDLGPLRGREEMPEIVSSTTKTVEKAKQDDWFDYLGEKKDFTKAIEILKKKIRYSKDIDDKISLKGWVCYAIFQTDSARGNAEYEKLILENSSNNISYLAFANNLIWNNSFKRALEIIDLGLSRCDRKISLTRLKAQCLWEINQKSQAVDLLNGAIALQPDPNLYTALAKNYGQMNDKKASANLLHRGYLQFPKDQELVLAFANAANDVEKFDLTVLLLTELIDLAPDNISYWGLLGNAYLSLELYNQALNAYEKASDLGNHKIAWILANIGNLYNRKNLYSKAEGSLKKSIQLESDSEYCHSRLSAVYASIDAESKKLSEILTTAKAHLSLDLLVP